MRKTKIVCTLGPVSSTEERIKELIIAGMNVARLNFAHGNYEQYKEQIKIINKVSEELEKPVGILIDIKGPEIRIGELEEEFIVLKNNDFITLTTIEMKGTKEKIYVNHKEFTCDVKIGSKVLIDDGNIELEVRDIKEKEVLCEVVDGGLLKPRKGVNLPGVSVSLPGVTKRDIEHIHFGIQENIDFIAMSFVRRASDILEIKDILKNNNKEQIQIISKIENQEGIVNFGEILEVSDGIMVARGDLGVEIPTEDVPIVQKMMIKKCNEQGKPVITATQMLDSMQNNPRPTRAETSDVANAIFDGTDAIMLSGETATGKYPVESVEMMVKIAKKIEDKLDYHEVFERNINVTEAIAQSSVNTTLDVNAEAIISPTETGYTPRMISKRRPIKPIFAVTSNEKTLKTMTLTWGVYPVRGKLAQTVEGMFAEAIDRTVNAGFVKKGDVVVITSGSTVGETGATNLLKIHKI